MLFWVREIAGWALVGLGLFLFYVCYVILLQPAPRILESGPLAFIGFIIFRGGIHLLKVAVAARICLHAHQQAESVRPRFLMLMGILRSMGSRRRRAVRCPPPLN